MLACLARNTSTTLVNKACILPLVALASCLSLLLCSLRMLRLDKAPNDLMVVDLIHFNLVQRSEHLYVFIEDIFLRNSCHSRRVMLLKAHDHVAD